MDKKLLISLGLAFVLSGTIGAVFADTTIYTDDLGRMHFLGRDAASNTGAKQNFTNSAEQDLTRKLYEESANGLNYVDHPLKDYENTFSDSRFTTSAWKNKFQNNVDEAKVSKKTTVEAKQGNLEGLNPYMNTPEAVEKGETNVVKTEKKKHWWRK